MDSNEDKWILPVTTPAQAVARARDIIIEERKGKQLGLKVRYAKLNRAMRKYFRFANVNLWAGLSGSGKSYLLNLVTEDFLDYDKPESINYHIDFTPIVFHFCFEMGSEDEILRSCAADLGFNYNYLLSSFYDKEIQDYNRLTDDELAMVDVYLKYYSNKSILFFETAGNIKMIYYTVLKYTAVYKSKARNRPSKFIVNIDHTLLVERLGEKDALELMANIGKIAIKLRKEVGAIVNLIGQLNNNIESTDRLLKPVLHYPIKSDIYAQGQLYNACDTVFTIHQPAMLRIAEYGIRKMPTANLIHLQVLKARKGDAGNILLFNNLANGKIESFVSQDTVVEEDENITNNL